MKKHNLIVFLTLLFVCCSMSSCVPEKEPEVIDTTTRVYGTIFDYSTGEPLPRAQVVLERWWHGEGYGQVVASTYSGSDGQYEFVINEVSDEYEYGIEVDCDGYYGDGYDISLSLGNSYNVDFALEPCR